MAFVLNVNGWQFIFLQWVKKSETCRLKEEFFIIYLHNIRAGEPEPGVFGSLEPKPEPLEKKNKEPEPLIYSSLIAGWPRCTVPDFFVYGTV